MIALVSLLLLQTPDLDRFKELIDRAEKSEAAIPAALDALSKAALTPGFDLKAYEKAAGEAEYATSVRSLAVARTQRNGVEVVGATLGDWSQVRARDRAGKELEIPKSLRLIKRYAANPQFVGSILVVIQPSVQDMGVRYGYRTAFLTSTNVGFQTAKELVGVWTVGDEQDSHLIIDGTRVTARTLDQPRHFFTSSPERLFRTVTTWDLSGSTPRLRSTQRFDLEMRAIDQWMGVALRAAKPTATQTRFRKSWDAQTPMLEGWKLAKTPKGSEVTLELGRRYRFRVAKQGLVSFLGVTEL